jgi:hypothetical protein
VRKAAWDNSTRQTKVDHSRSKKPAGRASQLLWQKARGKLVSESVVDVLQTREDRERERSKEDSVPALDPSSLDHLCVTSCNPRANDTEMFQLVAPVVGNVLLRHQENIVAYLEHRNEMAANATRYETQRRQLSLVISDEDALCELEGSLSNMGKVDAADVTDVMDVCLEKQLPRLPKLKEKTRRNRKEEWLTDLAANPEPGRKSTDLSSLLKKHSGSSEPAEGTGVVSSGPSTPTNKATMPLENSP